jgi:hypothetical protein
LEEGQYISFGLYYRNATGSNFIFSADFMLINTAIADINEYEPYIEGETIETTLEDGAELNSISPNMTITTDTDGVVIDTEYNKDSNIVIEKLTQAIISLGGNI